MKKLIVMLIVLLVVSNGWWFYRLLDQGITQSYRDRQVYQLEATRRQLMQMLPALAEDLPQAKIIEIASRYSSDDQFEKDGCIWTGWVGLKFSPGGKLVSVSPAWNYGDQDLCFPDDRA
jgi:hypothetical protein